MDWNGAIGSIQKFINVNAGGINSFLFKSLTATLIFIIAVIMAKVGSFIIRAILQKQKKFKKINVKKIDTATTLVVSVYRYLVYLVAIFSILSQYFIVTSVIAAAGIGGVALGFGAQSLIKDIIAGFFVVLEDQYVVGDMITIDSLTGIVEEMELRVTKFRNYNGDLYIIPNGEIKKVVNHTRGDKAVLVDIPLVYTIDMEKALAAAEEACTKASEVYKTVIVEKPKVLGITEMGKEYMTLRITAKTIPNNQWDVERYLRKCIQKEFTKNELAFPTLRGNINA